MVVTGVVVVGFDIDTPAPGSLGWLAGWPVWLGSLALVMAGLLRCFARFEAPPALPYGGTGWPTVLVAAALAGGGLLTLTVTGFSPGLPPFLGVLGILGGLMLTAPAAE
jgi:hypothetical protein